MVKLHILWRSRTCIVETSGVARILLPGGTGAWRTGSEVHGDNVVQKWKPYTYRTALPLPLLPRLEAHRHATARHQPPLAGRSKGKSTSPSWTEVASTVCRKSSTSRAKHIESTALTTSAERCDAQWTGDASTRPNYRKLKYRRSQARSKVLRALGWIRQHRSL